MAKKDVYAKTIPLAEPVEWGEETITEIKLRSPKGKHFKKLPVEPKTFGDIFPFVAAISDQPPAVLDELGAEDIISLMDAVADFIPGGLEIGGKSGRS